jgi:hypothetical protein
LCESPENGVPALRLSHPANQEQIPAGCDM